MKGGAGARAKLAEHPRSACCVSTVVKAELMVGVHKSNDPHRHAEILRVFLNGLQVLPFEERAADIYGPLRAGLEAKGEVIGANDMLIAAHTMSENLTLLTSDAHFARIENLSVEVWKKIP